MRREQTARSKTPARTVCASGTAWRNMIRVHGGRARESDQVVEKEQKSRTHIGIALMISSEGEDRNAKDKMCPQRLAPPANQGVKDVEMV